MINYLPDFEGGRFIDCVDKEQGACVAVPQSLHERTALVLDPAEPRLLKTPRIPDNTDTVDVARTLRVAQGGQLAVDETVAVGGFLAAYFRRFLRRNDESNHDLLQRLLSQYDSRAKLVEHRIEHMDDYEQPLSISMSYELQGAVERIDGRLSATMPAFWERDYLVPQPVPGRTSPFEIDSPMRVFTSSVVESVAGAVPTADSPAHDEFRDEFVSCTRQTIMGDGQLALKGEICTLRGRHSGNMYSCFHSSAEKAARSLEIRFFVDADDTESVSSGVS